MNNTQDLITNLSQQGAAPSRFALRRFVMPLVTVCLLSAVALLVVLEQPFASIERYGLGPMAIKWGFSIPLAIGAAFALHSLCQPGKNPRRRLIFLALPFVAVLGLLMVDLANNGGAFPGRTWPRCLIAMAVFSPLSFAGAILSARWMAPTQLRKAGAVAGLFGGGVAMSAYAPFCPELGMVYMAVFYCLPILTMAAIGWLAGPRLLRW